MRFTLILILASAILMTGCASNEKQATVARPETEPTRFGKPSKGKAPPIRWAVLDRGRVSVATFEWARKRSEEEFAGESLLPELKQQLAEYARLSNELQRVQTESARRRAESMRGGPPPFGGPPFDFRGDSNVAKASEALNDARRPIAEILERRAKRESELQYPIKDLVAEYANGRFDVVLDRSSLEFSVLYRKPLEVTDITEGVIELFRSKTNEKTFSERGR